MGYELEFANEAEEAVLAYLKQRCEGCRDEALDAIEAALLLLTQNPLIAAPGQGAFTRPTYRFEIEAGGVQRFLQVAFYYSPDERSIVVTAFGPVPL